MQKDYIKKKLVNFPVIMACLALLLTSGLTFAQTALSEDGPPVEFGPGDVQKISPIGNNQKVLIIYVQAKDYPILASELTSLNNTENQEITDFKKWFDETSWGQCTFDVTQQRSTGGNWYVLPQGMLTYSRATSLKAMEFRDSTQATTTNPAPPLTATASAAPPGPTDPISNFTSSNAGNYFYAVSSIRNGVESTLTRISSAVSVSAGDIVKLNITKAAGNTVDYYIIYRTSGGDVIGNYSRIAYLNAPANSTTFIDDGKFLDSLSDHTVLLQAAMDAASSDVGDYSVYNAIITIIYSPFLRGQSLGSYNFTVSGTTYNVQTINQASSTDFGRFCHEMGHWLGLPDQYDAITAGGRGFWTTMDGCNDRQYASWEKNFKLAWISPTDNVRSLERPPVGSPDLVETIKLYPTEKKDTIADAYTAIKIKATDTINYYVEGRTHFTGFASDTSASKIVVAMEAFDSGTGSSGRSLNRQQVLNVGDAAYKPEPSVEITYLSTNPGTNETYNVRVVLKAMQRPDPKITPWGAPPWETPDIWIDSEREGGGFDAASAVAPKPDNGEAAWVNHVNRVYAKITNVGAENAHNVRVHFKVNVPGGVGDAGTFVELPTVVPGLVDIPAGESRYVYAEWTPTVDQHTCIKVEIDPITDEADTNNNIAQENVHNFYSGASSPWHTVTIPVKLANPFSEKKQIFLTVNGLTTGWTASLDHKWVMVDPGAFKYINVTLTPPANADSCTKLKLDIQGLTLIDDFIQPYGGITPIIHLANPIQFPVIDVNKCNNDIILLHGPANTPPAVGDSFTVRGTTNPPVANKEIALIITDPDGKDSVVFTQTNARGEFFYLYIVTDKIGEWQLKAYYAGDDCHAPSQSTPVTFGEPAQADIFVTLNGPAVIPANAPTAFTVTYGNNGPNNSTDVLLTVQIPANMQYLGDSLGGSVETSPGVRAWYFSMLAPSLTNSFTLNLKPIPPVAPNTEFTITAQIVSGQTLTGSGVATPDPNLSNNTASLTCKVESCLPADIIALNSLNLADRTKLTAGSIFGGLYTETGADSIINAPALSVKGNLFMRSRSRINGDVRLAGTLQHQDGTVITGTLAENTWVILPPVSGAAIVCGTNDMTVNNDSAGSWSPGSYRDCMVRARGKLTLSSGTYNFRRMNIEPDAQLILNTASGPVIINVEEDLQFGDRSKQLCSSVLHRVAFYTNCHNTVRIGTDNLLTVGSITAPYATLQICSRTTVKGPLIANQIRTEPDVIIDCTK